MVRSKIDVWPVNSEKCSRLIAEMHQARPTGGINQC